MIAGQQDRWTLSRLCQALFSRCVDSLNFSRQAGELGFFVFLGQKVQKSDTIQNFLANGVQKTPCNWCLNRYY